MVNAVAAALMFLPLTPLAAQSPSPSPVPGASPKASTPKPKEGHIRFWNLIPPPTAPTLDLVLTTTGSEGRPLTSATPMNLYANYTGLPPGRYTLRVFRAGDRQNALKSFDLPLRDKSYFSLLATAQPDGQPGIELLDDTPDPTKTPNNRLTVRQFSPDTAVVITAAGRYRTDSLAFQKIQTLEDLPDGVVPLNMRATKTGAASVKTWDTQADFRASHHYTLFVVNDLYGRIRARVAVDGPSPEDEAEAAAEAKANP